MILQSVIAAIIYVFCIALSTYSIWRIGKLPIIITIPLAMSLLTLFLYISSFVPMSAAVALALSILCAILVAKFLAQKNFALQAPAIPKGYLIFFVVLTLIMIIPRAAFVLSPFGKTILFPYVGDETKHIAVIASLTANDTFPPRFPYDPTIPFAYYYFYYLLPAITLKILPHATTGFVWVTHVALTQYIAYTLFATLIFSLTKKRSLRLLGTGAMIFGTSLKIIPKIFHWFGVSTAHIEHWWQIAEDPLFGKPTLIGWQITHPMTLAIWTPQHQWAAALVVLSTLILFQKKHTVGTFFTMTILLAVILGTSAFVGVTFMAVLSVWIIVSRQKIRPWIFTLVCSIAIDYFLLVAFRQNQARIMFAPYLPLLPHIPQILAIPLFYIIETGFTIPVLFILGKAQGTTFLFLAIATIFPLIASRLFVSQFMNDLDMRIPILYTIMAPALLVYLLDRTTITTSWRKIIVWILFATVVISALSGCLELYFQSNSIESYPESLASSYKVMSKFTNPNDIVIVNDAYIADRVPLFSNRMTIKPVIPFSMDVYVPVRKNVELYYSTEICSFVTSARQKISHYHFVYAQLGNTAPLLCDEITRRLPKAAILFSSPGITLYRLD